MSKPRRIINPRRWKPPAAPANGGRASKTAPLTIERQLAVGGHGPEDVMFNDNGHLVTGLSDGSIVTIDPTPANGSSWATQEADRSASSRAVTAACSCATTIEGCCG